MTSKIGIKQENTEIISWSVMYWIYQGLLKHSVRCGLKINVELGKSFILFTFCIDGGKINFRYQWVGWCGKNLCKFFNDYFSFSSEEVSMVIQSQWRRRCLKFEELGDMWNSGWEDWEVNGLGECTMIARPH